MIAAVVLFSIPPSVMVPQVASMVARAVVTELVLEYLAFPKYTLTPLTNV